MIDASLSRAVAISPLVFALSDNELDRQFGQQKQLVADLLNFCATINKPGDIVALTKFVKNDDEDSLIRCSARTRPAALISEVMQRFEKDFSELVGGDGNNPLHLYFKQSNSNYAPAMEMMKLYSKLEKILIG